MARYTGHRQTQFLQIKARVFVAVDLPPGSPLTFALQQNDRPLASRTPLRGAIGLATMTKRQ